MNSTFIENKVLDLGSEKVPAWFARSFQLVSVIDMQRFYCEHLFEISQNLEYLRMAVRAPEYADADVGPEVKPHIVKYLDETLSHCRAVGLELSAIFIERKKTYLQDETMSFKDMSHVVENLQGRIMDELGMSLFFHLPKRKVEYFNKADLFGDETTTQFPAAILDIEEAGKCFALGRNTACVFHLMRVVEVGVMAFAQGLSVLSMVTSAQPNWGEVLRLTNQEIHRLNKAGDPMWTPEKRRFFENVQSDLSAVKNAWRNPTMHVENTYDEERAEDIFHAIKGWMRHMAKHLDESGKFTP